MKKCYIINICIRNHKSRIGGGNLTEYLKKYMVEINERLMLCHNRKDIEELLDEHRDKIAFMQHERIVHFLVTMMFAVVLSIFVCAFLFCEKIQLLLLIVIIMILLAFYIKHYYFLENTVQKMYGVYDEILKKSKEHDV